MVGGGHVPFEEAGGAKWVGRRGRRRLLALLALVLVETLLALAPAPVAAAALGTGTTTASAPTTTAGCRSDADCEDGDTCSVDVCEPTRGCHHDPVGLDALRGSIESALAVDACADQPVPHGITKLLKRALALIERPAATKSERHARRLVKAAMRPLRSSARRAVAAGRQGRIPAACAGALATRIQTAEARATCLVSPPPPKRGKPGEGPFACLSGPGPLITLSGAPAKTYKNRSLAPDTRIDARAATFLASPSDRYPLALGGGAGVCLAGGKVQGQYDRELSWAVMHKMNNAGVAFKSATTVDGIRIDNVTDGLRPEGKGPFTIRRTWLSYIRDDCVENDHLQGGVIEDSLFDGCYVAISERPTSAILRHGVDGRNDLLTIRGSLLRLQPMPGPRHGGASERGNGVFFKWNDRATKLALYDNVFMAETVAQDGAKSMHVPDRLVGCANNTMVWLGRGEYPARLPDCFRVTKDRTRWDNAVRDWLQRHPDVGH